MVMYSQAARFSQLRHLLTAAVVIAIAGGAALIGLGIVRFSTPGGLWLIVVGAATILASVVVAVIAFIALKIDANTLRVSTAIRDLHDEIERQGAKLDAVAESTRLSDTAKSIAHREEDRNALRAAIYNDIDLHDWEAASYLISEMERRFGYREEAERLQEKLNEARSEFYDQEVARALPLIHRLFDARQWDRAAEEIGRLLAAFPSEPRFVQLQEELAQRKEARKEQLVKEFAASVERDDIDIDTGMAILEELDQYLSREEAARVAESARKVVKGKLLQLGVRFRFAVIEERWRDALEVAVTIMDEFPNSQMAREVQERLVILRERAGMPADVEVSSSTPRGPGA
jgi:outer membrane protein assembly factor BamD (BamD/ComL family)